MSYDLRIRVKVEGCDVYAEIARPEYDSPTYNLGQLFRSCMDWDYSQSEKGDDGKYHSVYYRCADIIKNVEQGIRELRAHPKKYEHLLPENGWGTMHGAIKSLESLRDCIYEQAEDIPIECLWMSW